MTSQKFDLRKQFLADAKEIEDRMLEKIKRERFLKHFIEQDFIPWLQFAEHEAIRAEYESLTNGHKPTFTPEGIKAVQTKLERLVARTDPKKEEK